MKQKTIADRCGCTRKHVNETLALFKKIGLVQLVYQGQRRPRIIKFLQPKNKIFSYVEVTPEVTPKGIEGFEDTSNKELAYFKGILQQEERKRGIIFPNYIACLGITFEQKLKLSLCSESSYQTALEKAKRKAKQIRDIPSYVIGATLKIEEKKGNRIDWKKFYSTI